MTDSQTSHNRHLKKGQFFNYVHQTKDCGGLKSNAHSQKTSNKWTGLKGLTTYCSANTYKEYLCKH